MTRHTVFFRTPSVLFPLPENRRKGMMKWFFREAKIPFSELHLHRVLLAFLGRHADDDYVAGAFADTEAGA